ncbi:MAG: alpha/beta hydrolase [Coriobacteriales bacterium]|nr:alpha/beta hydrolase [Coriobacteriales bacterium]
MSAISDLVRKQFKEGDDIRDAGLTTPEDIERFDDIAYGTDTDWQMLDVYRPKNVKGELPVIVSIHGGGWVYGDKERYQWYCMDLALRGFVVVNFTYRLAPDFKFPASMEDTCAVFQWTVDHIAEYGGNVDKIFAVGDSAGGHMLGLFSNMCTNPAYATNFDFTPPAGFTPTAVAINCGACEIKLTNDPTDLTSALMGDFLPNGGDDRELDLVSVGKHVTEKFPPVFIMTSDGDFLHDQAGPLSQIMRDLKVVHELHIYGGIGEPLGHVFHCNMKSEDARRCNDDECRFFKRFL